MKINYLINKKIDRQKWDAIIAADPAGLPYAHTWYLDATTNGRWDALVADDYKLIMPLPWNRMLPGIRQVFAPLLSQQLGVFGPSPDDLTILKFLHAIPSHFKRVKIPLHQNLSALTGLNTSEIIREKKNLVLDLHQSYEKIHSNYRKSLRKRIRAATDRNTVRKGGEILEVFDFYKTNLSNKVKLSESEWQLVAKILSAISKKMKPVILQVRDANDERIGMGLFLITSRRVINLFGASNEQGKKDFSMHLMLDTVIKTYAGQSLYFDFEGSDIPGIYDFFKSFGSVEDNICVYERNTLPWFVKKII